MEYESPQQVFVLKFFACLGSVVSLITPFGMGIPIKYVPAQFFGYALLGAASWLMFWMALAQVVDSSVKSAWHLERMDRRTDETTAPSSEPLEF